MPEENRESLNENEPVAPSKTPAKPGIATVKSSGTSGRWEKKKKKRLHLRLQMTGCGSSGHSTEHGGSNFDTKSSSRSISSPGPYYL